MLSEPIKDHSHVKSFTEFSDEELIEESVRLSAFSDVDSLEVRVIKDILSGKCKGISKKERKLLTSIFYTNSSMDEIREKLNTGTLEMLRLKCVTFPWIKVIIEEHLQNT